MFCQQYLGLLQYINPPKTQQGGVTLADSMPKSGTRIPSNLRVNGLPFWYWVQSRAYRVRNLGPQKGKTRPREAYSDLQYACGSIPHISRQVVRVPQAACYKVTYPKDPNAHPHQNDFQVPKTIQRIVVGTRSLTFWVIGTSGFFCPNPKTYTK